MSKSVFSRLLMLVLIVFIAGLAQAQVPKNPFSVRASLTPSEVVTGGNFVITVAIMIPPEHFLYAERLAVTPQPNAGVIFEPAKFPVASEKPDPFGEQPVKIFADKPIEIAVPARLNRDIALGKTSIRLDVRYQGCTKKLCYFPKTEQFSLDFTVIAAAQETLAPAGLNAPTEAARPATLTDNLASIEAQPGNDQKVIPTSPPTQSASAIPAGSGLLPGFNLNKAMEKGLFWTYCLLFLAGVLTSLTPCVYPMIPITVAIFGSKKIKNRWQNIMLSLVYVLGIAIMYSSLGLIAALTGSVFGSFMANPLVIGAIATLFFLLALSMFGFYKISLPSALITNLTKSAGKNFISVFLMGLVCGIIFAPCTGPVLASILLFVSLTKNALIGFSMLFVYALGMGLLFFLIGIGAGTFLPRSGNWLHQIEHFFGVILIAAALYFLKNILPETIFMFLLAFFLILLATFWRRAESTEEQVTSWSTTFQHGIGTILLIIGIFLLVMSLLTSSIGRSFLSQLPNASFGPGQSSRALDQETSGSRAGEIAWLHSEMAAFQQAKAENKPIMIDFGAAWCLACKELDKFTFSEPTVIEYSRNFVTLKLDLTKTTPQTEKLSQKYAIAGLPLIVFLSPSGEIYPDIRITEFISAAQLQQWMKKVLEKANR
jgi:thiol:disulfide interchange protein DsbD